MLAVGHEDRVEAGLEHLGSELQARGAGQLLSDVAERTDPADRLAAAVLRQHHTLQHAPGVQAQHVAGAQQRVTVQLAQPFNEHLFVDDLAAHPLENLAVVALRQQLDRHVPQLREQLVAAADRAVQVGDEDALGGRLERGAQLGHQLLELILGLALGALVAQPEHVDRLAGTHPDPVDAPLDRDHAPVGMAHKAVRVDLRTFGGADPGRHVLPETLVLGRGRQLDHRPADQRRQRLAEQGGRGLVGRDDVQGQRLDQADSLEQAADQRFPHRRGRRHAAPRVSSVPVSRARSKK